MADWMDFFSFLAALGSLGTALAVYQHDIRKPALALLEMSGDGVRFELRDQGLEKQVQWRFSIPIVARNTGAASVGFAGLVLKCATVDSNIGLWVGSISGLSEGNRDYGSLAPYEVRMGKAVLVLAHPHGFSAPDLLAAVRRGLDLELAYTAVESDGQHPKSMPCYITTAVLDMISQRLPSSP